MSKQEPVCVSGLDKHATILITEHMCSRSQVIVDKAKHALPDQTPSAGAVLVMNVDMSMTNGSKPSTKTTELITTVDHNQHRLSWRFVSPVPIPSWVFGAERWQALRVIDDGGETKVLYESREEFHGFAAYLVKWFVGKKVVKGFERTAVALKNLVEGA
jgi:hypothetical protein